MKSSPGQIFDWAIILSGVNGSPNKNMPSPFPIGSSVDNPFETPDGATSSAFVMRTINEPVNTFVGDKLGSREVKLIELLIYLNGHDLAFLFDNNQQGNAVNQAPSVWEQVNIKNAAGVSQDCVQLSLGRSSDCISVPSLLASYVSAVGKYCVNNVTGASCAQGAAQSSPCNANDYDVNDNWSTARLNLPYAVLI